jgi:hypothetical protein
MHIADNPVILDGLIWHSCFLSLSRIVNTKKVTAQRLEILDASKWDAVLRLLGRTRQEAFGLGGKARADSFARWQG